MKRRNFLEKGLAFGAVFTTGTVSSMPSSNQNNTGDNFINISDMGAVGDGKTVNTKIIQNAIDSLAQSGGGVVYIAGGVFLTGMIQLKSNITLYIAKGSVLKASPHVSDFPDVVKSYELYDMKKNETRCHLIFVKDQKNVTITGGGTIDGNFEAHRKPSDNPYKWFGVKHPDKKISPMIEWVNCEDVTIENITVKDSSGWNNHFYMCTRLKLEGVKIANNVYAGHTDGFDISGCHHVTINNCDISTGDDAIVFKTPRTSRSCEKVTITNCVLRSNCAGIKFGTGSWHDFKQFAISNIVVHQSSRAVQFIAFDGGNITDVVINNIVCDTHASITMPRPIHIDTHRRRNNKTGQLSYPDYTKTSIVKNVFISNVIVRTAGRIMLTAEDGCKIKNIRLEGVQMDYDWLEDPVSIQNLSDAMQASNYSPDARTAYGAVVVKNVENFQLKDLTIDWPDSEVPNHIPPVYEKGKLVIDPKTSDKPYPKFYAFWGKNISGGVLDIPLAEASEKGVQKTIMENCSIINR
jgi:hypothetical protein